MNYLTEEERGRVRTALLARRAALLDEILEAEKATGETQFSTLLGKQGGDSSDEALAVTLGDLAAARLDLELSELKQLEAARVRLDDPDFGRCEACGEGIPLARLEVNPAASRCTVCQGNFERTQAAHAR